MPNVLLIVESPNKAKKIDEMFSGQMKAKATFGHVCDLPVNPSEGVGIDRKTLKGEYALTQNSARSTDGKRVINQLRTYLKMNPNTEVYLATDDDREGESISAFVAQYLDLPKTTPRIRFNSITKESIEIAMQRKDEINWNAVQSREARRLIDRIIGYTVSPILQQKLKSKVAAAGRVQTAVEALVIERERKIRSHKSQQYYTVEMDFGGWKADWQCQVAPLPPVKPKPNSLYDIDKVNAYCFDENTAKTAAAFRSLQVESCDVWEESKLPPAPLYTTSMIQMANKLFDWDAVKTMQVAQKLFEGDGAGHGLITYHRTDSPNIDPAVAVDIQQWLSSKNYPVGHVLNTWTPKNKQAQEAHEAIRPTYFMNEIAGSDDDQRKLYKLIRERAIYSQLAPAVYKVFQTVLVDSIRFNEHYKANTRSLEDPGWMVTKLFNAPEFSGVEEDENAADDTVPALPQMRPGTILKVVSGRVIPHQTKVPPRYTLNTLTSKLEVLSIGRPATIATILRNVQDKKTIEVREKKLHASSFSEQCYDFLYPRFGFAHIGYTAQLEKALDMIGEGEMDGPQLVHKVWDRLDEECLQLMQLN